MSSKQLYFAWFNFILTIQSLNRLDLGLSNTDCTCVFILLERGLVCLIYCIDKFEVSISGPRDVKNDVYIGTGQKKYLKPTQFHICVVGSNLSAWFKLYRQEFQIAVTPGPDRDGLDVYTEYICRSVEAQSGCLEEDKRGELQQKDHKGSSRLLLHGGWRLYVGKLALV